MRGGAQGREGRRETDLSGLHRRKSQKVLEVSVVSQPAVSFLSRSLKGPFFPPSGPGRTQALVSGGSLSMGIVVIV